jgi:hypothetical protein
MIMLLLLPALVIAIGLFGLVAVLKVAQLQKHNEDIE